MVLTAGIGCRHACIQLSNAPRPRIANERQEPGQANHDSLRARIPKCNGERQVSFGLCLSLAASEASAQDTSSAHICQASRDKATELGLTMSLQGEEGDIRMSLAALRK